MIKALIKLFLFFFVLALVSAVVIAGYLGFVPGLSALFGSDRPRDLGVVVTAEDQTNAQTKAVQFTGAGKIDTMWSSGELTALANTCTMDTCLFSDVQVKLNEDNTIEASAILHRERIDAFLQSRGASEAERSRAAKAFSWLKVNPAVSIKGTVSVLDNDVTMGLSRMELGRLRLPNSLLKLGTTQLEHVLEAVLDQVPLWNIQNLNVENGQVSLQASPTL